MVGPLPKTKRGNPYISIICYYATKYPLVIHIRSQDSDVVAETMMDVFTGLGVPKTMLSDQGTNLMSSLNTELCKLLNIRKLNTTPYHPQTNVLLKGSMELSRECFRLILKTNQVSGTNCFLICCSHTEKFP